jgi:MYXO-CTERM domain-containing protein
VSSLTINTSGRLDVGNGGIAINYGTPANDPVANIASYLTSGYAGGAWTGTAGIISTTAQGSSSSAVLSVGYADGNTDNGTPAGPNQILVKYTLAGDANLDGFVNSADLLSVIQNFNKSGTDWVHGNFTYSSSAPSTTSADLLLVIQNFNRTLPFSSEEGGPTAVLPLSGGNVVQLPEPSAMALAVAGAGGLLARRRRRKA